MPRALALAQFLIIGLMGPALHLLVRIQHTELQPEALARLAHFLSSHVLWLFAVPVLYAAVGNVLQARVGEMPVRIVGIALCVILILLLGVPSVLYLI